MLDEEKRSKMLNEMFEQDQTVNRAMNEEGYNALIQDCWMNIF